MLHHTIYAVDFLAYLGSNLCAHTLLIIIELLPEVCKLHPRLVELSIVAQSDFLCQILFQHEDVVFE